MNANNQKTKGKKIIKKETNLYSLQKSLPIQYFGSLKGSFKYKFSFQYSANNTNKLNISNFIFFMLILKMSEVLG